MLNGSIAARFRRVVERQRMADSTNSTQFPTLLVHSSSTRKPPTAFVLLDDSSSSQWFRADSRYALGANGLDPYCCNQLLALWACMQTVEAAEILRSKMLYRVTTVQ